MCFEYDEELGIKIIVRKLIASKLEIVLQLCITNQAEYLIRCVSLTQTHVIKCIHK